MRIRTKLSTLAVLAAVILTAACTTAPVETVAVTSTAEEVDTSTSPVISPTVDSQSEATGEPYPSPTAREEAPASSQPYPIPEVSNPTPQIEYVVPEPTQDKGVVMGRLLDINTGEPQIFQSVYLGIKIPLTPGPAYNYGLSEQTSPHTVTNEEGLFAIGNIDPGSYILMIFHPFAATVALEPNSDRELDVIVTAGEVLDLGEVSALAPEY